MYGALNNVSTATGAFFFVKNDNSEKNPDEIEAARLATLKQRIRDSGLPCKTYNSPEEFARLVSQVYLVTS